ncbi:MAG: adenylosuccinate lyase, partial [Archaeoglobaceae archaeon]
HILTRMINIVSKLTIDEENVRRNLEMQKGLNMSEAVMLALTKKGVNRQTAHEILRRVSLRAYANKTSLYEELLKEDSVMKFFTKEELFELLKPENYLGTAKERVDKVVEWVNNVLK